MKASDILVFMIILSMVVFGCTQAATSSNKAMMDKEANEMAEAGFEMMNGKMMMVDEKSKTSTSMEKDAMLNDGTKVTTLGKVTKKDGTIFVLKEGESIWMDGTFMKAGEMMNSSMEKEGQMTSSEYKGAVLAGTTTPYLDFNKEDYGNALKENKIILLNFYASWCPTCRAEQPIVFSAFNDLTRNDVVGFRVHWRDGEDNDDAVALAEQFGISHQHTKVLIKNGQKVLKAPDAWDKQRYLDELAKV